MSYWFNLFLCVYNSEYVFSYLLTYVYTSLLLLSQECNSYYGLIYAVVHNFNSQWV